MKRKNNFFSGALPHQAIAGLILAVGVILIAIFAPKNYHRSSVLPAAVSTAPSNAITTVDLSQFRWEMARTDEERRRGLSGRASLDPDAGMLFVFDQSWYHPFWMQDMNFSLDIVWLNHGRVVDVATLRAASSSLPLPDSHVPMAKADRALEVNAGLAKQLGLEPGAHVILPEL